MWFRFLAALALILGVALAACDAGPSSSEPPFSMVGAWSVDRSVSREMGTVSVSQTVVDRSRPSTGTIELSGRETGSLSEVVIYTTAVNDYHRLKLTSRTAGTTPQTYYELVFVQRTQSGARVQSITLDRFSELGDESYAVEATSDADLFRIGSASVSVDHELRATASPYGVVSLDGTLLLGSRRLEAGEDNVLSETTVSPAASGRTTEYTFRSDGTLRIAETDGASSMSRQGTWVQDDDGLRISVLGGDGRVETTDYAIHRGAGGVVLSSRAAARDACNAACREDRIIELAGVPGTLLETWSASEIHLSPL